MRKNILLAILLVAVVILNQKPPINYPTVYVFCQPEQIVYTYDDAGHPVDAKRLGDSVQVKKVDGDRMILTDGTWINSHKLVIDSPVVLAEPKLSSIRAGAVIRDSLHGNIIKRLGSDRLANVIAYSDEYVLLEGIGCVDRQWVSIGKWK